jgi:hypothetical protein
MPAQEEKVTAQVVLYSPRGSSILDKQQLSSRNIERFTPGRDVIERAITELEILGFECTPLYPTLTIRGPRSLFGKTFALKFELKNSAGGMSYLKPIGKIKLPHSLKNLVVDVVFGEPMEPFV